MPKDQAPGWPWTSGHGIRLGIGSGRVSHLWFGFEFGNFPQKHQIFEFFSLRAGSESTQVEGGSASYLLWLKSKLGSGQGPSLLQTTFNPGSPKNSKYF